MNLQTAIATGLAERTRRGIAAVFLAQHAIGRDDAVAFVPRTPAETREFGRLRKSGAIHSAGNLYWLDRPALHADNEARRRVLIPLTVVLLLVAAIIPLFFYSDVPLISVSGVAR